ncbi:MAG: hypothetical protein BMS9Abin06_0887 [Gammaproteobacteria bacterium]|nr:MAG: hypothetical protein BMS9Abin06_0887 [Gammaproteobacteria bacterium]
MNTVTGRSLVFTGSALWACSNFSVSFLFMWKVLLILIIPQSTLILFFHFWRENPDSNRNGCQHNREPDKKIADIIDPGSCS